MTAPASEVPGPRPAAGAAVRDPDLILARVHLLLGLLSLARTELETLAGRGGLDDEAIRDLAEARWRTGDMAGAGEAAGAWLEGHPDDILGLVIAAESQAALGRPGEARRLAGRALERADGSLDPVFAGMQRSAIWPVEAGAASGPVGVLFDDLHPGPVPVRPLAAEARPAGRGDLAGPAPVAVPVDSIPSEGQSAAPAGPSLWGEDATGLGPAAASDALDPAALFHQAQATLDAGHPAEAATGLILALRAAPGLAPAVLDLLSGRSEAILTLVRGDAERIVGREVEAMRDHALAAGALVRDRPPGAVEPDPADRARLPADAPDAVQPDASPPDQETP
jgi:hypothetical protein